VAAAALITHLVAQAALVAAAQVVMGGKAEPQVRQTPEVVVVVEVLRPVQSGMAAQVVLAL
jgi:hypothetical protein